jgi:hypothetical protein
MDALPFPQELVAALFNFRHQPPHVGLFDADDIDKLWPAAWSRKVDLRLPCPSDVNMRRIVVSPVDNEPKAMGAVNDNHRLKVT